MFPRIFCLSFSDAFRQICVDCVDCVNNACRVCGGPYDVDDFQVTLISTGGRNVENIGELCEPQRPPLAGEGGPLEAPPEAEKLSTVASFPIKIGPKYAIRKVCRYFVFVE